MSDETTDLTRLLRAAGTGERRDLDALLEALYADLRRLAASHLESERGNHTLNPTALVHEAYVRLIDQRCTMWHDRVHFFAIASQIIRRILVDHARARGAAKRGGGAARLPAEAMDAVASTPPAIDQPDLMSLDAALTELAAINARQASIVEMRYFGGMTVPEIAAALGIGARSVDREWQAARVWLFARLEGNPVATEPAGGSGGHGTTA